jgi:hypothetical protein
MMTTNELITAAIADCQTLVTIYKGTADERSYPKGRGIATDGRFQVYVVPVTGRIAPRQAHHRITYYVKSEGGKFKRVSQAVFEAERAVTDNTPNWVEVDRDTKIDMQRSGYLIQNLNYGQRFMVLAEDLAAFKAGKA